MPELYIGLMSGTSVDSIDAVLVDIGESVQLLQSHSEPIESELKQRIIELCTEGSAEIDRMGQLDIDLGRKFALATNNLLSKAARDATNAIDARDITAIGSHGQTIRHRPPLAENSCGFTLQIGDPNTLAQQTGIITVADFRRRDMAAGGQGAPLAPAFHRALTPKAIKTAAFLNLGGIANLTLIHNSDLVCGFDTGPANGLLDAWIQKHRGEDYDMCGQWAASGNSDSELLSLLLQHPFLKRNYPKSTGREDFNLDWLQQVLSRLRVAPAAEDVQATLLEFTAQTVAEAINTLPHQPEVIYLCGGGAHNRALTSALDQLTGTISLSSTDAIGMPVDWLEASAFAWLASRTLNRQATRLSRVTGADGEAVLGGIYYP